MLVDDTLPPPKLPAPADAAANGEPGVGSIESVADNDERVPFTLSEMMDRFLEFDLTARKCMIGMFTR